MVRLNTLFYLPGRALSAASDWVSDRRLAWRWNTIKEKGGSQWDIGYATADLMVKRFGAEVYFSVTLDKAVERPGPQIKKDDLDFLNFNRGAMTWLWDHQKQFGMEICGARRSDGVVERLPRDYFAEITTVTHTACECAGCTATRAIRKAQQVKP